MRTLGFAAVLAALLFACDLPPGKVGQGQLYLSGEARFDAYFRDVHAIQVWAAQWPDDKKATRKPLISILDLTPDAADVTIVQATHEKMTFLTHESGGTKLETFVDEAKVSTTGGAKHDQGLFRAIEETAGGELQRAKKLNSMLPKMDELAKVGRSLEPKVQDTFQKQAPGKMTEVRSELSASFTILSDITTKARRAMRECDDFVSDLQRAVATGTEIGAGHHEKAKPDKADKPEKPEKPEHEKPEASDKPEPAKPPPPKPKHTTEPPPPPPPKPAPVAKRDDTPKPPPAPPAPPPVAKPPAKPAEGEVFNP